VVSVKG